MGQALQLKVPASRGVVLLCSCLTACCLPFVLGLERALLKTLKGLEQGGGFQPVGWGGSLKLPLELVPPLRGGVCHGKGRFGAATSNPATASVPPNLCLHVGNGLARGAF